MITRAQAEALLTLAESLEACEKVGLTISGDADGDQVICKDGRYLHNTMHPDLQPVRIRRAISELYPKSET